MTDPVPEGPSPAPDEPERVDLVALDPEGWIVVDDGVMGGRSEGHVGLCGDVRGGVRHAPPTLCFRGVLRTRGGGFTSIRSLDLVQPLMPHHEAIALRVRGDGRTYACDLREAPRIRGSGPTWKAEFETAARRVQEIVLPLRAFVPTWRGRTLEGPTPSWGRISSVGITIADGIDGPFQLEIVGIVAR